MWVSLRMCEEHTLQLDHWKTNLVNQEETYLFESSLLLPTLTHFSNTDHLYFSPMRFDAF